MELGLQVLVVAQLFPPDMGGGATRAYNVAIGLKRAGCKITIVSAAPHYPNGNIPTRYRWKPLRVDYIEGMRVIRTFVPPIPSEGYGKRILLFLSFMMSSLFALPLIGRIDAVYASNPNITSVFPSRIMSLLNRCPLVQNVDDLWPESLYDLGVDSQSMLSRIGRILAGVSYKLASAITPISPGYVDVIRRDYGVSSERIHVLRAGVDASKHAPPPAECKKSNDVFRVVYIGALSPAYDFDQVFEAASILSSHKDVEFTIQGGGELSSYLKSKIVSTKITNLRVIDKIVSREEVVRIMHQANALLLPLSGKGSIELGCSAKLYEYQAAGKPILCCSNGQPGEYVAMTESGIVIQPGNANKLAESVLRLRDNPNHAKYLGSNGRKYVQSMLSLEEIGTTLKEIIQDLISVSK